MIIIGVKNNKVSDKLSIFIKKINSFRKMYNRKMYNRKMYKFRKKEKKKILD